ncbi:MAG: hypothetical protein KDD11_17545, partial [Acidobacteria bacterium]|nr:hypothetical protein [Acidobacteriota bacterium]
MKLLAPMCLLAFLLTGCTDRAGVTGPAGEPGIVRGHDDVLLRPREAGGVEALPLFLGSGGRIGLCLEVLPAVDTTGWRLAFTVGGRSLGDPVAAAVRTAGTVCFDADLPPDLPRPAVLELCDGLLGANRRGLRS